MSGTDDRLTIDLTPRLAEDLDRLSAALGLGPLDAIRQVITSAAHSLTEATLGAQGLSLTVAISETDDGPVVRLTPINCNLEGDMPGEYWLSPLA